MPWSAEDASRHTKKANAGKEQKQWAAVANSVLQKTGDDAEAIRIANGVIRNAHPANIRRKKQVPAR